MKKIGFLLLMLTLVSVGQAQNKARTVFDNADFVIEPLNSINTIGSDISPALVAGELYFSAVPEKYFNKQTLERKNKAFYDTYSAQLDENGMATSERKLAPGFGEKCHEGPVSYCAATGELFVTLSNTVDMETVHKMFPTENIRLRLVIMKKNDNQWKITEELPFNNPKFHFAHPAISQTGDTLIFSSDMDNGSSGKSDLYISVRSKGNWSEPQNLGNVINTGGNEMFPAFLPGGLLSFASNGHKGTYGGLDIWYTRFPNPIKVINAGDKINSTSDDFGLIINTNRKVGYFSSNRPGKGSDDNYLLRINSLNEIFNGKVFDDLTNQLIEGTDLQLFDCNGKVIAKIKSDSKGHFQFEVLKNSCLVIEADKEAYEKVRKDISEINYVELRLKHHEPYLTIQITDKSSGATLTGAKLEILSGEYDPLSLTKEDKSFRLKLNQSAKYEFYASKEGYFPVKINYSGNGNTPEEYSLTIALDKLAAGKQFILEDLYYDLNKFNIRPEAALILDRLFKILNENPEIKIEIGSHTDCRASGNYNLKLSQNRSASVVAYLVDKGISAKRVVAKGYGETQLVNKCADGVACSEAEHQANRRTMVKILEN